MSVRVTWCVMIVRKACAEREGGGERRHESNRRPAGAYDLARWLAKNPIEKRKWRKDGVCDLNLARYLYLLMVN